MYEDLGEVELKTGERVRVGAVRAPDAEWCGRLEEMLAHKGGIWNWQNSTLLKTDVGIEARYYVLHRDGAPFANVMVVEVARAGLFGHVWTEPEDRRKGAMSLLIGRQMEHFRARGGEALFLGTGFDSVPYHLYERHGFRGIEPGSGRMAYYARSRSEFEADYFAPGKTSIESVGWRHWPSSAALFTGDFPGALRCTPLKMIGRMSTEGPLLPVIRDLADGPPRAVAAGLEKSCAVVGLAAWGWDALWPGTCLVDVYCHPDHWERAPEIMRALRLPEADRCVAYAETVADSKDRALREAGFRPEAKLQGWVAESAPADKGERRALDVQVYRR